MELELHVAAGDRAAEPLETSPQDGAVWQRQYANHTEAKNDVGDYVVNFYNCERLNPALGNLAPAVYERKMVVQAPIVVSEIT